MSKYRKVLLDKNLEINEESVKAAKIIKSIKENENFYYTWIVLDFLIMSLYMVPFISASIVSMIILAYGVMYMLDFLLNTIGKYNLVRDIEYIINDNYDKKTIDSKYTLYNIIALILIYSVIVILYCTAFLGPSRYIVGSIFLIFSIRRLIECPKAVRKAYEILKDK